MNKFLLVGNSNGCGYGDGDTNNGYGDSNSEYDGNGDGSAYANSYGKGSSCIYDDFKLCADGFGNGYGTITFCTRKL
jgi:hypothetical protein